jgi:hypothetical protein
MNIQVSEWDIQRRIEREFPRPLHSLTRGIVVDAVFKSGVRRQVLMAGLCLHKSQNSRDVPVIRDHQLPVEGHNKPRVRLIHDLPRHISYPCCRENQTRALQAQERFLCDVRLPLGRNCGVARLHRRVGRSAECQEQQNDLKNTQVGLAIDDLRCVDGCTRTLPLRAKVGPVARAFFALIGGVLPLLGGFYGAKALAARRRRSTLLGASILILSATVSFICIGIATFGGVELSLR